MDINIQDLTLGNKKFIAKKTEGIKKKRAPKHSKGELFLCGPVPWNWLSTAAQTCGKGSALQVGLAIWFLSGLNDKSATVKLTNKTLHSLGVKRNAGYRGLQTLEDNKLVSVIRKRGASPIVTILGIQKPSNESIL